MIPYWVIAIFGAAPTFAVILGVLAMRHYPKRSESDLIFFGGYGLAWGLAVLLWPIAVLFTLFSAVISIFALCLRQWVKCSQAASTKDHVYHD